MTGRSLRLRRALGVGAVLLAGLGLAAAPASARTFVSLGFGVPLFAGPVYPPPPPVYYAPPPAYYYPPPAYGYSPPPAYGYSPPPVSAPSSSYSPAPVSQEECREYTATSSIGGVPQQMVGTACRQPDGTWRIIR
jgi:hypothetical protein